MRSGVATVVALSSTRVLEEAEATERCGAEKDFTIASEAGAISETELGLETTILWFSD